VTFISIHSFIIYVVFFGACMRCIRLCSLKPGVTVPVCRCHPALFLPLAARWGRLVGASFLRACVHSLCLVGPARQLCCPFARPLSLFRGPRLSEPSRLNRSRSPSWMRTRPRVFQPRPHTLEPFSRAQTHSLAPLAKLLPQPITLALSLALRACP
jgi:hypothetical protein